MKSKSFDLKDSTGGKVKLNKTFDFVDLYKSAAETNATLVEKHKFTLGTHEENSSASHVSSIANPKHERAHNKKKKKSKGEVINISHVSVGSEASYHTDKKKQSTNAVTATSTPKVSAKIQKQGSNVKSIMKSSTLVDDSMNGLNVEESPQKPKKRNKSVSFMLDDTEEVAVKKTKSDESLLNTKMEKSAGKEIKTYEKKKFKKIKKQLQAEKENKAANMETDQSTMQQQTGSGQKVKTHVDVMDSAPSDGHTVNDHKKKKLKKTKSEKRVEEYSKQTENETNNNDVQTEPKIKKVKKKKRHVKSAPLDTTETEGEPVTKSRKKETKADVIVENLENLTIGDNAHTLTNLLDEMTVIDKDKRKKNKQRRKKEITNKTANISSSETADLEKIEEGKEKVKWKKRKWNKDKKGDMDEDLATSIIIENLPLGVMCSYKKLLADHFEKCGIIKKIGIAEMYPTEEPKPVFTTTITFYSEGAATKALEEDNSIIEGGRIHVKRPLPPTQTTLVVRSYAELTEQSLSSVFSSAGRIRSIRQLVKGKKTMAAAFIEFDGPETVEHAIKTAQDVKIGGKKIHVSKFENRTSKSKNRKKVKSNESENEGDSEDSND